MEYILTFIGIIFAVFLMIGIIRCIYLFKERRGYIIMELKRANSEKEALYWRRKLKNLYLDFIPLYSVLRHRRRR